MNILAEINVTAFESMKSTHAHVITLFQELGNIKRGKYKDLIIRCREAIAIENRELYTSLKSQLPAVTFCGEFKNGRKASNVVKYNNLLVFDIDNIEGNKLNKIILELKTDKYILALWLSPSGHGLKGLIRIDGDIDSHKAFFNAIRIYFLDTYQIELDRSGSDISRLCFTSWDEDLFYNGNAQIFNNYLEIEEPMGEKKNTKISPLVQLSKNAFATEGLNKKSDSKIIREIINYIRKKDISITETYDDWVKIALAISVTFSYDLGEKLFLNLCEQDKEKHSHEQSVRLLKYCYSKRGNNSSSTISLATIIFFAKSKGFSIKG